jgi:regulatory protein
MEKKRTRQPRRISGKYLENAALYYLQRYATSAENLRRVLARKVKRSCAFHKVPEDEFHPLIDSLIRRYQSSGLLNDTGFAEAKAATLRRQGKSRRTIEAKLKEKGLGRADIEKAIEKAGGEDEHELAAACAHARKKKLGRWRIKPLKDPRDASKEMAAMARAGFSYDVARRALDYKGEDEDEI